MNKVLLKIYVLIMLECRLSVEDASILFGVEPEQLRKEIMDFLKLGSLQHSVEYLLYEVSYYRGENKKGLFKAKVYTNKLYKILKVKNKEEKAALLNQLIKVLQGPDIRSLIDKTGLYTEDEKYSILKYQAKYGYSVREMAKRFGFDQHAIKRWTDNLTDPELKIRLGILKEYNLDLFANIKSTKKR